MASMPELGSKISLISKSDIRYEGQLYTVDPNECTIALANVRSYGTEDRDGQFSIPPQEEIFDYILFRGSDIKDIRVVNNVPRVPHDPAIMQMHVSAQNQSNFQPQFSMPPVMPNVGGQVGPFGGANNQPGPFGAMSAPNVPHGAQLPQVTPGLPFGQPQQSQQQPTPQQPAGQQPQPQPQQQNNQQAQQKTSVLDLIGGSRSTTPVSLNSRKSPTAEMGTQASQKDGTRRNNNRAQSDRLDSQGSHENRNQQRNNQYQGNNQNRGSNWDRNNNQNARNNLRQQRRPGNHPQSFRQNNQNTNGRPKTTIKFESDFDFEQANTKFEEMRLSLAKLKVGEETKPEQVNGEVEKKEKDDSGNETGAGEQEQEEDDVTVGYDKAKSFFDNISCEAANDRKGKNRTDWRLERKLNSETFGVSSARRGGFYNYNRGRPGNNGNYYNNNNRNGNYRNNGYNNGNNYRGGNFRNTRNFNQRNQNQGNSQQNENPTTSLPQEKQSVTQQSQPTAQAPAVAAGGNES